MEACPELPRSNKSPAGQSHKLLYALVHPCEFRLNETPAESVLQCEHLLALFEMERGIQRRLCWIQ